MIDSGHLQILDLTLTITHSIIKIVFILDISQIHEQLPYQDASLVLTGPCYLILMMALTNSIINFSHIILHRIF